MLHVIREAVYLYKDYPDAFARLRDRAMAQDFSWNRSPGTTCGSTALSLAFPGKSLPWKRLPRRLPPPLRSR